MWWGDPPWWVPEVVVAFIVSVIVLVAGAWLDDRRSDRDHEIAAAADVRAERLENLRFVRDRSSADRLQEPTSRALTSPVSMLAARVVWDSRRRWRSCAG
ncbi:Uncharacterised protein [Mycobacteroides abscessus subsp. abscessus]|nr:Uncharacterised protein [Mycobacteroides abscessus subsp. abscessus]